MSVPVAGLDIPWGIDLLTRVGEASPAVVTVMNMLREEGRRAPRR